jgi:hypothetical protein
MIVCTITFDGIDYNIVDTEEDDYFRVIRASDGFVKGRYMCLGERKYRIFGRLGIHDSAIAAITTIAVF